MRRLSVIIAIIVVIMALMGGCGKHPPNIPQSNDAGNTQTISPVSGGSETDSNTQGAQVIVKSGSNVSSKDKELILNEINAELDNMIQSINNLEDVSDQDLQF